MSVDDAEAWGRLADLLRGAREASLGTLDPEGGPYVSAAGFVAEWNDKNGRIWFLLSGIARHTRNLLQDGRASVLVADENRNIPIQGRTRATLAGSAVRLADPAKAQALKPKYLERYPQAEAFFSLPDFSFWNFTPREIHWFGGFGTARTLVPEGHGT